MMLKKDKSSKGKTLKPSALSRACAEGRADEVHKLLRTSGIVASINKPDEQGITPLLLTCTFASTSTSETDLFNYLSICKMLLDSGADPTLGTSTNTNYPLHILSKICISPSNASLKIFFESLLGYIISKGAEINKLNAEGLTPLHEAARKGAADACACLLDKGANVAARSGRGGLTPLHMAVSANHEPTVKVLLRKGADPDVKCDTGSARDVASTLKLTRIIHLIEQHEPSGKQNPAAPASTTAGAPAPSAVVAPAVEVQATVGPSRDTVQLDDLDINALVDAITSAGTADAPKNAPSLPTPTLGRPPSIPVPDRPPQPPDTDEYPVTDTADVKFVVDASGQPTIRAASLDRLIERMTGLRDPEPNFVTAFLLTYRSFTTPIHLLTKLLKRYTSSDLETVQIRVLDILKAWIELHYYDFEEKDIGLAMNDFCNGEVLAEQKFLLDNLKNALRTQKERAAELAWQDVMAGAPNATSSLSFGELNVDDVVGQLTLIESRIYRRIRPKELLDQRWMKKGKEENSPNIMSMIQHFNHVTRWVQTEVLSVSNLKKRAEMLQKMITMAKAFRQLNNFNGVIEILAGLSTTAIRRLANTWALVDEMHKAHLHELESLMSFQGSYKNYRAALRETKPPCLPYLGSICDSCISQILTQAAGMYLSDISFINEGQLNQVDGGLINFLKYSKIARVVAEIQYYQEASHSTSGLTERDTIIEWWRATHSQLINERDAHAKSLKLESLGEKEDPETALVEAANLRKENDELKVRVAQLEQLTHQQQDTIEKLTQKLNTMQREMRMTRDISQMLNAARSPRAKAASAATPSPPTSNVSALSPRAAPVIMSPQELPPPPVVASPAEPVSEPESSPEPTADLETSPPPSTSPPRAVAFAVDDEVSATQRQLQENAARLAELREKYKARQASTDPATTVPAGTGSSALRRTNDASTPPSGSSPKTSMIKRPLVEPPSAVAKTKAPTDDTSGASTAAALREKFKLAGKTTSVPGSPVGTRTEITPFNSAPGGEGELASPTPEDPNALLERMRALRENYKRDGSAPGAVSPRGGEALAPIPVVSPPAGAVRVMPAPQPGKGGRPLPKAGAKK